MDNSDSENSNNEIFLKMRDDFSDCELKIIYTDLNLGHRFIRFQTSLDFERLKDIIINNFINTDKGIISYQFQRDDEVETVLLILIKELYHINFKEMMKLKKIIQLYQIFPKYIILSK